MSGSARGELSQTDKQLNPHDLVKEIEGQPPESAVQTAQGIFNDLITRASQLKGTKAGQPCAKMCGLVDASSRSRVPQLQQWAFSKETSLRLFNFFIDWNEVEQHRSMRLILDVLPGLVKRNPDTAIADSVKVVVLDTLVSIIGGKSTKPSLKSSLKALDHFVNKSLFSAQDVAASHRRVYSSSHWESELELWNEIMSQLFHAMTITYIRALAGKVIVTVYRALRSTSTYVVSDINGRTFSMEIWLQWLQQALESFPLLLDGIKNYVFLPLFKDDRADSLRLLEHMKSLDLAPTPEASDEVKVDTLLGFSALEVGKKVGIVEEPGDSLPETQSYVVLEESMLDGCLASPSADVRSLALSLIISSHSSTKPFPRDSLLLLQRHLPHQFSEPGPKFRMDLLSQMKKLYKRARGAIPVIQRALDRLDGPANATATAPAKQKIGVSAKAVGEWSLERLNQALSSHKGFLTWLFRCLRSELIPTASYQRHFTASRAFLSILRVELEEPKLWEPDEEKVPFFSIFDDVWTRTVLDLTLNPFEDVRGTATDILKIFFSEPRFIHVAGPQGIPHIIRGFLTRADDLVTRTARADYSDGAARVYELLFRFCGGQQERLAFLMGLVELLEGKISLAELDLGRAVLEAPLHSSFASLNVVWQATVESTYTSDQLELLGGIQDRLVRCAQRTWAAVKYVLCDDSPEGHLPQELEETDGLDTKDLLSYSFRAVHESSNLMRSMVMPLKGGRQGPNLRPSVDVFAAIGNLTFEQLTNLRHRGAFTTVALTFATCCQMVKYLDDSTSDTSEGESFLDIWYKGSLQCILTQASTTRRSAGIPAMITGILSADASRPSFDKVVQDLMDIGGRVAHSSQTDGSNLPQVHALNSLKDIFKSAQLAQFGRVESHAPQGLELAAGCLQSGIWAIRNSGLLLLRSLIDNLFGTNDSKDTIEAGWDGKATKLQYKKYPILPVVLVNLLRSGHEVMKPSTGTTAAEAVFPALDIIRRAGPPEALRDELYQLISEYLGSSVWHVREMAARALCSFLLREGWISAIQDVFDDPTFGRTSSSYANRFHGGLLTTKYVFEKLLDVMPDLAQRDMVHLLDLLLELYNRNHQFLRQCPEVYALYAEILNLVSEERLSCAPRSDPADLNGDGDHEPDTDLTEHFVRRSLLNGQMAIQDVYRALEQDDIRSLTTKALKMAAEAPEAVVDTLEAIPSIYNRSTTPKIAAELCRLYVAVCSDTEAVEPRVVAVRNLAEMIDYLLQTGALDAIPPMSDLEAILANSGRTKRSSNPAWSDGILRLSGCVLAVFVLRQDNEGTLSGGEALFQRLEYWSVMVGSSGQEDKPFDTRCAAVQAVKSFISAGTASLFLSLAENSSPNPSPSFLPVLLVLYDFLNDDDDEIRDLAATAVRSLLNSQPLSPLVAADRLLAFLEETYGATPDFSSVVVRRAIGGPSFRTLATTPSPDMDDVLADCETAQEQLSSALHFDDALFAVEKQNLYVDPVRETKRWTSILASSLSRSAPCSSSSSSLATKALMTWAQNGLDTLTEYASSHPDGPMGWTSQDDVYAVCARVVLCAAAAVTMGNESDSTTEGVVASETTSQARRVLQSKLDDFVTCGGGQGIHGLLLSYCRGGSDKLQ